MSPLVRTVRERQADECDPAGCSIARGRAARTAARVANPPESTILAEIRLDLGREPDLVLWRNGVAGVEVYDSGRGGARHHHAGLPRGSADLIGILTLQWAGMLGPGIGRFFCLEIKTLTGRLTAEQELWLELVRSRGGFGGVARSKEEARAALHRARSGAYK